MAIGQKQKEIIIDRNSNTEAIFNENDPFSFISILKLNADYLGYYDMEGIDPSIAQKLKGKHNLMFYRGPMSDIPDVELDPTSDNFGNNKIVTINEGGSTYESYVYSMTDSAHIDLESISRIVLILNDSSGTLQQRITKIELWKKYNNDFVRVLSLDGQSILSFQEFELTTRLSKQWSDKFLSKSPSLWSAMRDTCIERLTWSKNQRNELKKYEHWISFLQNYFPSGMFHGMPSHQYRIALVEDKNISTLHTWDDYERYHPLSTVLGDSLETYGADTLINRNNVFSMFDSVHYMFLQDPNPIIEKDYSKANYLQPALHEVDGKYYYLYEPSEVSVFWVDYSPHIFVSYSIAYDSLSNQIQAKPTVLSFCLEKTGQKPYVVSVMFIDELNKPWNTFVQPYVADLPSYNLWETTAFKAFNKAINNKKNYFDFETKKGNKRYEKRMELYNH